jgi:hypothetical protein
LDGFALLDTLGTSPVSCEDGLVMEAVPPGCSVTVGCALNLDAQSEHAVVRALLRFHGDEIALESEPVPISRALQPAPALGFLVRNARFRRDAVLAEPRLTIPAIVASDAGKIVPQTPDSATDVRSTALDAAAVRHLAGLPGLMRHLWATAALFADAGDDELRAQRLAAARVALRSVFDRLSIKLRMPQYRIAPEDVLDPAAWGALATLEEIEPGEPGKALAGGLLCAVRAIAPHRGDPLAAAAAASYREVLRSQLNGCSDKVIIDALHRPQASLDEALDAVLACEADAVLA